MLWTAPPWHESAIEAGAVGHPMIRRTQGTQTTTTVGTTCSGARPIPFRGVDEMLVSAKAGVQLLARLNETALIWESVACPIPWDTESELELLSRPQTPQSGL